jgi:hypothetical protein
VLLTAAARSMTAALLAVGHLAPTLSITIVAVIGGGQPLSAGVQSAATWVDRMLARAPGLPTTPR